MVDAASGAAVLLSGPAADRAVLVVGATGMLGKACLAGLRETCARVDGTQRRDPAQPFHLRIGDDAALDAILGAGRYDYIVNCAAVLAGSALQTDDARRREAIAADADFPLALAAAATRHGARVLHVSTDAVFSGRSREPYDETASPDPADPYGQAKALGEPRSTDALSVRCSIAGVDRSGGRGLVEWFLSHAEGSALTGFEDQRWTGVTTLQLVDAFAKLIATDAFSMLRGVSPVHHFCPNPTVTKYEFLAALNRATGDKRIVRAGLANNGTYGRVLTSRYGVFNALAQTDAGWDRLLTDLLRSR